MPGKIFFTSPVRAASSASALDLSSIGTKKRNATPSRDPKLLTLRKSGIRGDDMGELKLILQLKREAQSVTGAPPVGEFSVWALGVLAVDMTDSSSPDATPTQQVSLLCCLTNECGVPDITLFRQAGFLWEMAPSRSHFVGSRRDPHARSSETPSLSGDGHPF